MRTSSLYRIVLAAVMAVFALIPVAAGAGPTGAQQAHSTDEPDTVSDDQLIEDAYRALLGRTPEAEGKAHWSTRFDEGMTQREFLTAIVDSDEHRDHLVERAFRSILDRAPEAEALDWYAGLLADSTTATTVRADLYASAEYDRHAGDGTDEGWVDAIFADVLGREPDADGRRYFVGQLDAGVPREPLASAILVSEEATDGPDLGFDDVDPERRSLAANLDSLEIDLDRNVLPDAATVVVRVDGTPVPGQVGEGDFDDILTFGIDSIPDSVEPGERVQISVVVAAHDGTGVDRAGYGFDYVRPEGALSRGDSGTVVADLQSDLAELGYWVGPIDGNYGTLTQQAVYAFQKYEGLERTGVFDDAERRALADAERPRPRSTSGYRFEVDKDRQLLILAVDGRAAWVWNTSSGTGEPYTYDGEQYIADTPSGHWDVYRQIDGVRESNLGRLYRPKYFHTDGIAFHGYPSVPPYPASHGCVRLTDPAIDFIWDQDLMPIGTKVWVY